MKLEFESEIEKLEQYHMAHFPLSQRIFCADNRNMYNVDLLALAAINRSMSNIKGFIALFKEDNYLLVNSVIRLQLDTLLRFFSLHLVSNPKKLAEHILDGKQIDHLKDKSGEKMRDSYLCKQFSEIEKLPWINQVYKRSSGFIHLSRTHVMSIFDHEVSSSLDPSILPFTLGKAGGNAAPEEFKMESIKCMNHITEILLSYIEGWALTKEGIEESTNKSKEYEIP